MCSLTSWVVGRITLTSGFCWLQVWFAIISFNWLCKFSSPCKYFKENPAKLRIFTSVSHNLIINCLESSKNSLLKLSNIANVKISCFPVQVPCSIHVSDMGGAFGDEVPVILQYSSTLFCVHDVWMSSANLEKVKIAFIMLTKHCSMADMLLLYCRYTSEASNIVNWLTAGESW